MKIFVITEIDPDYMDSHAYTNKAKATAKVKEFEENGVEFEENEVDLGSNEYLLVYGEEGEFTVEPIHKQDIKTFLGKTDNKYGAILDMKKGYARCYSGSDLETENSVAEFQDGDVNESIKSLKHIMLFEQFIAEKKDEKYIAYVDDKRKPGGSDKEIKNDYAGKYKDPWMSFLSEENGIGLSDVINAIDIASIDDKIKGISIFSSFLTIQS